MNVLVTGDSASAATLAAELTELGLACDVAPPGAGMATDFVALEEGIAEAQVVVCAGREDPALAAAIVAAKAGVPLAVVLTDGDSSPEARIIGHLAERSGAAAQVAEWAQCHAQGPAADLD